MKIPSLPVQDIMENPKYHSQIKNYKAQKL